MMLDEELECRSLLGSNGSFYIFIFHGDFVQSVRLTYILPSHIEVKKFLGSGFGRVLEIGIT